MTATTVPKLLLGPSPNPAFLATTTGSAITFQMNGSGDKIEFIFYAPESFTLDSLQIQSSTVATGGNITVDIEGVDLSTGRGDGVTNGSTATLASVSATPATYVVTGLGATITQGNLYAAVLTWSSGDTTFRLSYGNSLSYALPYVHTVDGAGPTHTLTQLTLMMVGLGTSSTAWKYIPGFSGAGALTTQAYADATNPDGRACRVYYPVPFRVCGVAFDASMVATTGTYTINFTDTSGTLLTSMTISADPEVTGGAGASAQINRFKMFYFPATYSCSANTEYWMELRATGGGNVTDVIIDYTNNGSLECLFSKDMYYGQRDGGSGAFSSTTTRWLAMWPIIDQFDDGTGGGGGTNQRHIIGG